MFLTSGARSLERGCWTYKDVGWEREVGGFLGSWTIFPVVHLIFWKISRTDKMRAGTFVGLAAASIGSTFAHPGPHPDASGRYTLQAEGIKAQFIPYAATLTNLWVKG